MFVSPVCVYIFFHYKSLQDIWAGDINLSVISLQMAIKTMSVDEVTQTKCGPEDLWAQDRALESSNSKQFKAWICEHSPKEAVCEVERSEERALDITNI